MNPHWFNPLTTLMVFSIMSNSDTMTLILTLPPHVKLHNIFGTMYTYIY